MSQLAAYDARRSFDTYAWVFLCHFRFPSIGIAKTTDSEAGGRVRHHAFVVYNPSSEEPATKVIHFRMEKKKDKSQRKSVPFTPGIMIKLGNGKYGGNCIISAKESQEIMRREHGRHPLPRIDESTSDISELGQKSNPKDSMKQSKSDNSSSYIIVTCSDDANPKFNRLELRTDPPTFIELQPGENILTVEEYPALKFGFRQISENDTETTDESRSHGMEDNCQEVVSIDMSHFDGSEMTSMNSMFEYMQGLSIINIAGLNTCHVTNMDYAFSSILCAYIEGLESIDTSSVRTMREAFSWCSFNVLDLSSFNMSGVENIRDIFAHFQCEELILNNWNLNKTVFRNEIFRGDPDAYKISLKHCPLETIKFIAEEYLNFFGKENLNELSIERKFRLSCHQDEDIITVGVHHIRQYKGKKIQYSEDGMTLLSADKNIEIAIIKPGVKTIAEGAFKDCKKLHTVYINSDMQNIGSNAFAGCESLRWINPTFVESVGHQAFKGCIRLKSLYFEESLRFLGESVFRGSGLEYVRLPLNTDTNYGFSFDGAAALKYIQLVRYNNDQLSYSIFRPDHTNFASVPRVTVENEDSYSTEYPMSFNGVLCEWLLPPVKEEAEEDYEEEYERVTATIVPDSTIAIPGSVEALDKYCLGTRKCPILYIPESVQFIDEDVLDIYHGTLLTPETNLEQLLSILPTDAGDIKILTI